jgi:hypothetical protein
MTEILENARKNQATYLCNTGLDNKVSLYKRPFPLPALYEQEKSFDVRVCHTQHNIPVVFDSLSVIVIYLQP